MVGTCTSTWADVIADVASDVSMSDALIIGMSEINTSVSTLSAVRTSYCKDTGECGAKERGKDDLLGD